MHFSLRYLLMFCILNTLLRSEQRAPLTPKILHCQTWHIWHKGLNTFAFGKGKPIAKRWFFDVLQGQTNLSLNGQWEKTVDITQIFLASMKLDGYKSVVWIGRFGDDHFSYRSNIFLQANKGYKVSLLVIIFQSLGMLIPASSSDSGIQWLCCFGAGSFCNITNWTKSNVFSFFQFV